MFANYFRNSVSVNLGNKVMKLVESLITETGQGSECHLTFVRGRLDTSHLGLWHKDHP